VNGNYIETIRDAIEDNTYYEDTESECEVLTMEKWFVSTFGVKTHDRISKYAITSDNIQIFEWYCERHGSFDNDDMITAARQGHDMAIRWLCEKRYNVPYYARCEAVKNGHIDVIKTLFEAGSRFNSDDIINALRANRMDVFRYILDVTSSRPHMAIIYITDRHEDVDTIKWMIHRGFKITPFVLRWMIRDDKLEQVKYCIDHLKLNVADEGYDISSKTSVEMIRYLENTCPLPSNIMREAIINHNFELIEWLIESGRSIPSGIYLELIGRKDIRMLDWCISRGVPLDTNMINRIIGKYGVSMVKWCRDNGCIFTEDSVELAIRSGDVEVLRWLLTNGCPYKSDFSLPLFKERHVLTLRWLIENKYPLVDNAIELAEKRFVPEFVRWMESELPKRISRK
jgi:hypothetical protein